jgi:ABC-type antimicrobial peptide transport system permease subunit
MTAEEIEKAKAQADIVVVEQERINGYQVTPQFFGAWGLEAAYGSVFAEGEAEGLSNKVILGSTAAASIAAETGAEPLSLVGKKLLAREGYQTIVGVLKPTGTSELDDSFYSPYRTMTVSGPGGGPRFFGGNVQLRFTVSDPAKLASTEAILSDWFAERFGEGQIAISNPRNEAQRLIDRNAGIGLLILILSLSGLFIALVNVSNILLSRGLRMRRNVGILMALGASRSRIMGLFSAEAAVVAAAGSALGAALSLPLSGTMQGALGLSTGAWGYALVGAVASCVLTLVFSLVPAWQSSRLVPADAMRA